MNKQLKTFDTLTRVALDAALMSLRRAAQAEEKKVHELRALEAASTQRRAALDDCGGADLATWAGADERWDAWCIEARSRLNIERAACRAEWEIQRDVASRAFSKHLAVQKLIERQAEIHKRAASRR